MFKNLLFASKQEKKDKIAEEMKDLEFHSNELAKYLFDEKTLLRFNANKKVELPTTFKKMTWYPYDKVLKDFRYGKHKKSTIFETINDIVKGKIKNIYKNVYNGVHPAWFLLFYKEFMDDGYIFQPKIHSVKNNDGIFEIGHEKFKIKEQHCESFKIYYFLLHNKDINDIFEEIEPELIKKLYLDLAIEKYVKPTRIYSGKYLDMCYIFDDKEMNTLTVEINEKHHDKDMDEIRKKQVFAFTLKRIINYYNDDGLISVAKDLFKELSKCFYKINPRVGLCMYMVKCNGFNLRNALLFSNFYCKIEENNLTLSYVINELKNRQFKDVEESICKLIEKEELEADCFVNCLNPKKLIKNGKLRKAKKNNILLNNLGLKEILSSAKKKYFDDIKDYKDFKKDVAQSYALFMQNYFRMVHDLLNNSSEELQISLRDWLKTILVLFANDFQAI